MALLTQPVETSELQGPTNITMVVNDQNEGCGNPENPQGMSVEVEANGQSEFMHALSLTPAKQVGTQNTLHTPVCNVVESEMEWSPLSVDCIDLLPDEYLQFIENMDQLKSGKVNFLSGPPGNQKPRIQTKMSDVM